MHLNNYVKLAILGIICSCGLSPSAHAQWPTLDVSVITGEMQSIMQQIEQYKTQIMECKTVGKINSAIGDAKASMSKFKADTIDAAKKKAEKLKAQADKVKKVQEDIKKAKAEYEKKKKQFEDYKQKLEEAKKEVSDKIQEAKETVNEAKETIDTAKQAASSAVNDVKSQVNDVKSTVNDAQNAVNGAVSQAQGTLSEVQSQVNNAQSNVLGTQNNATGNPLAEVKQTAQTQGVPAAAAAFEQTINDAAANGNTAVLDAASKMDTADLVISDSKVYDDTTPPAYQGRQAFTPPTSASEQAPTEAVVNQPIVESIDLRPEAEEKEVVDPMFRASQQIVAPDPEIKEEETKPAPKDESGETPTFRRQPFEIQGFLDDGEFARQSRIKISRAETLQFADVAKECSSYNNTIQNGDDGKIIVMPERLAKYCCIEADKLTDLNLMPDCAVKMLKKMNDKDAEVQSDANSEYMAIIGEQSKNGLAESIIDVNKATDYKSKRLKPFLEKAANVKTTRDGISFITQSNIEMLYLMNQIRRIYTTAAVSDGIAGINGIKAEALIAGGRATMEELGLEGEEPDAGIYIDTEYQANITRDDIKDYPIIPENLAKKCAIDVTKNINKVQDCYLQTVKNAHQKDNEDTKIGLTFIDSITFQETLNLLAKSLYQKVKSAQYDEKLEEVDNSDQSATTVRQNAEAMSKTGYEMTVALDDIINAYASRIANKSLNMLPTLRPEPEKESGQKTEG